MSKNSQRLEPASRTVPKSPSPSSSTAPAIGTASRSSVPAVASPSRTTTSSRCTNTASTSTSRRWPSSDCRTTCAPARCSTFKPGSACDTTRDSWIFPGRKRCTRTRAFGWSNGGTADSGRGKRT
uniref:(northern house mosquito) hypothetical protein n=1 Tax=Culex pipiens TaxID=7175 RepID=A0A8D8NZK4_CULPI